MEQKLTDSGKKFLILAVFAVAMGAFEAIVVIYLRRIYYPEGFEFPLKLFSSKMLSIELLREFSTILMIVSVAFLSARDALKRLAWFLYIFAVWDIFYYLFLKMLIGWPPSILTWDILFLIPVTWTGPVLAPVICSITMIFMTICIIYPQDRGYRVRMTGLEWLFVISGAFMILWSFMKDYLLIIVRGGFWRDFLNIAENSEFRLAVSGFIPSSFSWYTFAAGEILILAGLFLLLRRSLRVSA